MAKSCYYFPKFIMLGKALVTFSKAPKKEERERLREEGDKINFVDYKVGKRQTFGF